MENCVFCNWKKDEKEILYETPNFFVAVGIGIAAPGHVMLITKEHYICYADMPAKMREEFKAAKELVYSKVKGEFSTPFMVEYGILEQSVRHAHLHFIPKERKETKFFKGYKINDLFKEMGIPADLARHEATWEKARELKNKYGGYIFLKDGAAKLFAEFPDGFSSKNLSYRRFFNGKLKLSDIPATWKEMSEVDVRVDQIKKEITLARIKF